MRNSILESTGCKYNCTTNNSQGGCRCSSGCCCGILVALVLGAALLGSCGSTNYSQVQTNTNYEVQNGK